MDVADVAGKLPEDLYRVISNSIDSFRPAQEKALKAGLLESNNILVCTPTASGKTLIAEMALLTAILKQKGTGLYIVPLKALASEKFEAFRERYGHIIKIGLAVGDVDEPANRVLQNDLVIATSEKIDAMLRHDTSWVNQVKCVVLDEIHLLNDVGRGPTVEVVVTILRQLASLQILGLSATIGNPKELAAWLDAELVVDHWRPVALRKGIYYQNTIEFSERE